MSLPASPQAAKPLPDIPFALVLLVPLIAPAALIVFLLLDPSGRLYRAVVEGEAGLIETLSVALAAIGLVHALNAWRRRAALPRRWLGWGLALLALGFLYIAGEEASWGQHWFGWATPEFWAAHNRQGEATLHNLALPLDRVPKTIIAVLAVAGGVIWPLLRRRRGIRLEPADWRHWLLPTDAVVPAAVTALGLRLIDRIIVWSHADDAWSWQPDLTEMVEFCLIAFLALYAASADRRLRAWRERHI